MAPRPQREVDGEVVTTPVLVRSRSRSGRVYEMQLTPEGFAVHQNEGCEGEIYHGPLGCWHSKENNDVTQAVATYQGGGAVERIEFSPEQIQVLKNTICRGASDAELQLFTYACQDTGLDPFLKQIWAIMRKVKVDDHYEQQLTIQIGIDGYRVMRDRIRDKDGVPLFEGMDGPQWSDDGVEWFDYPSDKPNFARVAIWRRGIPRPFTAVTRGSAYEQDSPLWRKMYPEQLAKCAEALALRRAFPAEMSKMPTGSVADYEPEPLDAPEYTPPVAAIEGEVIKHEAPQQGPSGSEPDVRTASATGSDPAATSPDAPKASKEQLASITEWEEQVKDRRNGAALNTCKAWMANSYGYAKGQPKNLIDVDATVYIDVLKSCAETGSMPFA